MTEVPSYTKVLTLGARGTERALVGSVVVQEKIREGGRRCQHH